MQITYSLMTKDSLHLQARMANRTPQTWYVRWGRFLLFPALALLLFVHSPITHGDWRLILAMTAGITLAWRGVFYGLSRAWTIQTYARRPGAMATRTLSLQSEGMVEELPGMTSRMQWRDVSEIADERGYLAFRTDAYAMSPRLIVFFVPERAFATRTDAQSFLDEARLRQAAASGPAPERPSSQGATDLQVSVPFSLTAGEFGWMLMQGRRNGVRNADLVTPLAIAFFLSSAVWAASGNPAASSVVAVVVGGVFLANATRAAQREPIRKGPAARLLGDYRLTLTPQGVEQHAPALVNWYSWSVITHIAEKHHYVLFYVEDAAVCLVAMSAFGSAEEARVFLQTAQAFRQSALTGQAPPPVEQVASWPPPPMR